MKLSCSIPLLLSVAATSSAATVGPIRNAKAVSGLVQKSRRLDEGRRLDDDYAFLQNYELKFLSCVGGQLSMNEDGQYNFNQDMAVFRLCPTDSGCDSDKAAGCSEGYGDYVVDLNSYVQTYFEDQGENMQGDDAFRLEEYAECSAYELAEEAEGEEAEGEEEEREGEEEGEGDRKERKLKRKLEQGSGYYIGPTCTDDGTDVKLELFTDYACSVVSEDVSFEDLSGMSLPYSSGGLVSTSCTSCYGANENGEYEVSELCTGLYGVSYGCETKMESYSANGKDESHCSYIEELTYVKSSGGGEGVGRPGLVVFLILLGVALVGVGGYMFYQKKKKIKGSVDSDGLMT